MGTDIQGWVEFKAGQSDDWEAVVRIQFLVERAYDLFGMLFGVRGVREVLPLAADRGLPADLSAEVKCDIEPPCEHPTWILWQEITAIDWDEELDVPALRLTYGKPVQRKDFLRPGWSVLFAMMAALATRFGADGVRLVVWFDW